MNYAVDAMGGDHAPDAIVKGAVDSLKHAAPDEKMILVGDEKVITEILKELGVNDARIDIAHAPQHISMEESPVEAVRTKPNSSIVRMCELGSARKSKDPVDFVLSAGNTGACVSAATMHMKRLPGVHRPGIACVIPAFHGPIVMCDVGANPEPRPSHLAQYGVMAETYAHHILGIEQPRIAQMNIGSEERKGTPIIREVRAILESSQHLNYVGYVEGRDIFEDTADVVITDGFVGNILLKLAEGLARSLFKAMANEIFTKDPEVALQVQPLLEDLIKRNDYKEYGGAPLLGVNGVCVICHGSSDATTISNAIRNARTYVKQHVNDAIVQRVSELNEDPASSTTEAIA